MKGNYPGQILTVVSVDVNNGIYHVAYGIVESESKESWTWFLSCLGEDLDLEANSNFTFITDRQKGLLPALKDLFHAAEHRYCVRHIHDNMNLIFKGSQYKELLWKCATTTTKVHFERANDEFKGYNRMAHEWLRKIPPKYWSKSHFLGRTNCDLLINNICEIVIEKSQGPLTPTMTKIFNAIKEKASRCVVVWNGADLFQVNEGRQNQVVVNLTNKSCTCRKWEVSSIPCKHAVACIFNMTDNEMQVGLPEDWVHQSMRLQTWKTIYSFKINPVPGRQFWAKSQVPTRLIPPYIPPQVGRPCKKRKKSAGEVTEMVKDGKLTRKGGTVTCCKCGQKGHKKRSCKGPGSTSASASQPARASASQPASASASQPASASARASASAKQPQRATSQVASAPKTTKNVAASVKKTPTR
uniref:SWIM-type domain-containing protein n=1 Tax=Tanacetum cinerariifolium TaxID=118510 RepID=A0A6L2NXX9_TANCI|nr:hypothetical protein [Tanacetum cinerariifolium]